jgi:hypothetical protein
MSSDVGFVAEEGPGAARRQPLRNSFRTLRAPGQVGAVAAGCDTDDLSE